MNYTSSDPESDWGLLREELLWQRQVRVPLRVPPILTMSADGHREPGATANGAPRNNAEQDDSPYHDYGPSLFATIQASALAVAGAVVGRPRVRTVPRGRAGVQ